MAELKLTMLGNKASRMRSSKSPIAVSHMVASLSQIVGEKGIDTVMLRDNSSTNLKHQLENSLSDQITFKMEWYFVILRDLFAF